MSSHRLGCHIVYCPFRFFSCTWMAISSRLKRVFRSFETTTRYSMFATVFVELIIADFKEFLICSGDRAVVFWWCS